MISNRSSILRALFLRRRLLFRSEILSQVIALVKRQAVKLPPATRILVFCRKAKLPLHYNADKLLTGVIADSRTQTHASQYHHL
jgi:hypothetical protein